jgi:NhaP-type Na+/H+ or K+/H+ antiporter
MTAAIESFGLIVLVVAAVGLAAVFSNRLSQRLRIPAPAIFLLGAAAVSDLLPRLGRLHVELVEQVVTVALAVILFEGGMHIGWRRFRPAATATAWIGVAGTLLTAAAMALCAHLLLAWTGGWHCCWAPRWPRPTLQWCFPCSAAARSPAAAVSCWKGSPVPTTRWASR